MKRSTAIGITVVVVLCTGLTLRPASRAQTSPAPVPQPAASARFAFGGNVAQVPAEFIGNLVFLPVRVNQGQPSLFRARFDGAGFFGRPTSAPPNWASRTCGPRC